jgi:hypothetical protein
VSEQWLEGYATSRPIAFAFLREKCGWVWAVIIIRYYDFFHVGMDPVSVLLRDCHYAEVVYEALHEGVPADHFYREAIACIHDNHIRTEVNKAFEEGEPVEERGQGVPQT